MQKIYSGKHLPIYAQIGLFDAEDPDAYPEWQTGDENVIIGAKGVAVATAPTTGQTYVDVEVYHGRNAAWSPMSAGEIQIGVQGILVGEAGCDYARIPWKAGKVLVCVYADGLRDAITHVIFAIEDGDPELGPPHADTP